MAKVLSYSARDPLFDAAVRIGDQLCDAAIFDADGRNANWLGRRDIVDDPIIARYSVRTGAIGPELYAGSAGIALFLTGLYAATGEKRFAATAAAALRRSVRYLQTTILPLHPFSFFAGHAGVLSAVSRLTTVAPEEGLKSEFAWLTEAIAIADPPKGLDIIAGTAGGILALLDNAEAGNCLDQARRCGERLCESATWDGDACVWQIDAAADGRISPPLAGLAHGGAGMALALLALHRRSPDVRFLRTAQGALAFTDRLFNETEGAWIDTRAPHQLGEGSAQGRFQSGWCHGGAGILLVRHLAATIDTANAAVHARYAERGARAAAQAMHALSQQAQGDPTLCHGLLGHSEALHDYARRTGDTNLEQRCRDLVATRACRPVALAEWPSGVNAGGHNPSLMIGAAGIGYHLLRVSRPDVLPPILTLFAE